MARLLWKKFMMGWRRYWNLLACSGATFITFCKYSIKMEMACWSILNSATLSYQSTQCLRANLPTRHPKTKTRMSTSTIRGKYTSTEETCFRTTHVANLQTYGEHILKFATHCWARNEFGRKKKSKLEIQKLSRFKNKFQIFVNDKRQNYIIRNIISSFILNAALIL